MSHNSPPSASGPADQVAPAGGGPPRRRAFFYWFVALIGAFASLLAGLPVVRYYFAPKRREIDWLTVGPIDSFTIGETRLATCDDPLRQPGEPALADNEVYVRREAPGEDGAARFLVFNIHCTHAGCAVDWVPQTDSFVCPCHHGVFRADGSRVSGPPRRGLFQCAWRTRNERLEIRALRYSTIEYIRNDTSRSE
jgi:Rieske Fe-S protein